MEALSARNSLFANVVDQLNEVANLLRALAETLDALRRSLMVSRIYSCHRWFASATASPPLVATSHRVPGNVRGTLALPDILTATRPFHRRLRSHEAILAWTGRPAGFRQVPRERPASMPGRAVAAGSPLVESWSPVRAGIRPP